LISIIRLARKLRLIIRRTGAVERYVIKFFILFYKFCLTYLIIKAII
jgi:hypothetical protein